MDSPPAISKKLHLTNPDANFRQNWAKYFICIVVHHHHKAVSALM